MTPDDLPAILGGKPAFPTGPPAWPGDDPRVRKALDRAVRDGTWGVYHGPHCETLKQSLSEFHGAEFVELCASGTAAVELALRGLRIESGDEVVMAAYDFKANFQNVLVVGATPVLVDLRPDNWQLNIDQLDLAVTSRTKAVLASHLHGGLVDMPKLMEWASAHEIAVIEDACQCPGALIGDRRAGMWGNVGVHSFGGSKLLTAGRGGAVLTNDSAVHQRIRLYVSRGNDAYPLSELQAAVLIPQLDQLDTLNTVRRRNAEALGEQLASRGLTAFVNSPKTSPAFYKLGLCYEPAAFGNLTREGFESAIQAEGIALSSGFRALHRIHSKRRFRQVGDLAIASDADDRVLTLHHPILAGDETGMAIVADAIDKIAKSSASLMNSIPS